MATNSMIIDSISVDYNYDQCGYFYSEQQSSKYISSCVTNIPLTCFLIAQTKVGINANDDRCSECLVVPIDPCQRSYYKCLNTSKMRKAYRLAGEMLLKI